jgi:hypothetical protein
VVVLLVGSPFACSSSAPLAAAGGACTLATDCQEGLVCCNGEKGSNTCVASVSCLLPGGAEIADAGMPGTDGGEAGDDGAGGDDATMPASGLDATPPPDDTGSSEPPEAEPPVKDAGKPPIVDASKPDDAGTAPEAAAPPPVDAGGVTD